MSTVTKYATSNSAISGTWNNPTNAYTDNGTYTTIIPTIYELEERLYFFASCEIPAGSTINSVSVETQFKQSASFDAEAAYVQAYYTSRLETAASNATSPLTDTVISRSLATMPTVAALNSGSFGAVIGAAREDASVTFSFDYVKLTVDYTAPSGNTVSVNIGGVWKTGTVSVNIGGVWKAADSVKVNIGGTWK